MKLRTPARCMPAAPPAPFEVSFAQFVEEQLRPLLPPEPAILQYHRELMRYIAGARALFITRRVRGQTRGKSVCTLDGTRLLPSDNSPAWWWHMRMFHEVDVSSENFAEFVKTTPTHIFEVSKYDTVYTAGWHAAHILDAKDGDVDWRSWTRANAARRFVRNVHPLNLFYVPKADWQRVGRDPELTGYVASVYATRWPDIWAEFTAVAGVPALRPDAADRILRIDRHAASTRSSDVLDSRPSRRNSMRSSDETPWGFVLGTREPRQIALILSRHPDAETYRRRFVKGLTLERFVAFGNALHNYTRASKLRKLAPDDLVRQAEVGFNRLERWMAESCEKWIATHASDGVRGRGGSGNAESSESSCWTGAISLLRQGSDAGLEAVGRRDLAGLVTAALRVVTGPYETARRRRSHLNG